MRGKLHLWESGLLDLDELAIYEYMLLKRGRYKYAKVDMPTMQALFGSAKKIRRILNSIESKAPEMFWQSNEEGKSRKIYYVTRYEDIQPYSLFELATCGATVETRRQKILAQKLKDTERRLKAGKVRKTPIAPQYG